MDDQLQQHNLRIGSLEQAMRSAAQQSQEKLQKDNQEKVLKFIMELNAKAFDKAQAYTNVIIIAGYASAFSLWSSTKASLPQNANILFALLIGISIACFILYEIYGMIERAKLLKLNRALILEGLPPDAFLRKLEEVKNAENKSIAVGTKVWTIAIALTVPPALLSIFLLFYNYMAILIGFTLWPQ